eukprot:COSAG05_NODE_314_length_11610_cov_17.223265_9_plen_82_part_00
MILMRDADLYDDLGDVLKRLFGKRLGKLLTFTIAMAGGDEDVAANELDDEQNAVQGWKTRRRRFIKMRMVASQAVASEFIV